MLPPRLREEQGKLLHHNIIAKIQWEPQSPLTLKAGQWLGDATETGIQTAICIRDIKPMPPKLSVEAFRVLPKTRELLHHPIDFHGAQGNLVAIRIVTWSKSNQAFSDYNPEIPPKSPDKSWIYGKAPIVDLQWDPKDWKWQATKGFRETDFFKYSTKRGYNAQLATEGEDSQAIKELNFLRWAKKDQLRLHAFL